MRRARTTPSEARVAQREFDNVPATITITRPQIGGEDETIRIQIRASDSAGLRGLVFEVKALDFMLALTGRAEVPAVRVDPKAPKG